MIRFLKRIKHFISPPTKYESQIEYWKDRAKKYGVRSVVHLGHTEEELKSITEFQKSFLFPLYKRHLQGDEKVILDFGCGPGRFTTGLEELTKAKVYGVDPIQYLIELAPAAENVEFRVMQEGLIPLEDKSVDSAWVCLVFGSITDAEVITKTIEEIKRVLKPQATLFLVEKTSEDLSNFHTKSEKFYTKLFDFLDLAKIDQYSDLEDYNSVFIGKMK